MAGEAAILSVREGQRLRGAAVRLFSVVTAAGGDAAAVAAAADPRSGLAVPTPGSPHPDDDGLVARPPMIYPVGFRDAVSGLRVAGGDRFFNVRVRYVQAGGPEDPSCQ